METNHDTENASIIASRDARGSDVLTLNVGGKQFVQTLRSTLTIVPATKLAEMFSGRWDDSLPKDKDGNFFVDCKGELFVALHDFLRDLSMMTSPELTRVPPMTPSFGDPKDEFSFRRMVDSFGLTNAFYNYEIYEYGKTVATWNAREVMSQDCSIFDCTLQNLSGASYRPFALDRPNFNVKSACHTRKVQAFEVRLSSDSDCKVGWMCKDPVFENDAKRFHAKLSHIFLKATKNVIGYFDRDGEWHDSGPLHKQVGQTSIIRCGKNTETGELEWSVDGVRVFTTSISMTYGAESKDGNTRILGWKAFDDCEMVPYVSVYSGTCRFSALELES